MSPTCVIYLLVIVFYLTIRKGDTLNLLHSKDCDACANKHLLDMHHKKLAQLVTYEKRTDYVFRWYLNVDQDVKELKNNSNYLSTVVEDLLKNREDFQELRKKVNDIVMFLDEPLIMLGKMSLGSKDKIMSQYNVDHGSEKYPSESLIWGRSAHQKGNGENRFQIVTTTEKRVESFTPIENEAQPNVTSLPENYDPTVGEKEIINNNFNLTIKKVKSINSDDENEITDVNYIASDNENTERPISSDNDLDTTRSSPTTTTEVFANVKELSSDSVDIDVETTVTTPMYSRGATRGDHSETTPEYSTSADLTGKLGLELEHLKILVETVRSNLSLVVTNNNEMKFTLSVLENELLNTSLSVTKLEGKLQEYETQIENLNNEQLSSQNNYIKLKLSTEAKINDWAKHFETFKVSLAKKTSQSLNTILTSFEKQLRESMHAQILQVMSQQVPEQNEHRNQVIDLADMLQDTRNELSFLSKEFETFRNKSLEFQREVTETASSIHIKLKSLQEAVAIHRDHDSNKIEMLESKDKTLMKKVEENNRDLIKINAMIGNVEVRTTEKLADIKEEVNLLKEDLSWLLSKGKNTTSNVIPSENSGKAAASRKDGQELIMKSLEAHIYKVISEKYDLKIHRLEKEVSRLKELVSENHQADKLSSEGKAEITKFKSGVNAQNTLVKTPESPWSYSEFKEQTKQTPIMKCKARERFSIMPGSEEWCVEKCKAGFCPENKCICQ